jgi:site-specific recombinase XerD
MSLVRIDSQPPASLAKPLEEAREFIRESVPENTRRAYATDWAIFSDWCREKRVSNLPAHPATVSAFLADESKASKPSTLRRRLAAIAKMHSVASHPNPCSTEAVKATMKGIERTYGIASQGKAPATLAKVEKMVATCNPMTLDGLRSRAIILMGFAGAFRRSELASLDMSDLKWSDEGVLVTVRHSKTDQRGEGMKKAIPYVNEGGGLCAATALRAWLTAARIDSGAVFRPFGRNSLPKNCCMTPDAVAIIVKVSAKRAGFDPREFAGHSLRSGHVTEARARGVADSDTMSVTGHKRVETLNMYDKRENAFTKTSAGAVLTPRKGG